MEERQHDFRQATSADTEWVYQLSTRCYRDVVIRQFGSWDEDWQREHFAQKWDPSRYRIVVCEGRDIGVLCAGFEEDHMFLREIQIDPEFQHRGLGTSIVEDLIRQVQRRSVPLRLRVLRLNRARRLYSRLGFSQIGETDTHVLLEKKP